MRRTWKVLQIIMVTLSIESATGMSRNDEVEFNSDKLSLRYRKIYYESITLHSLGRKSDQPDQFPEGVGPARWLLALSHSPRSSWKPDSPRYFFPARSVIYVTPLQDASVADFAKAYPRLVENAQVLRVVLPRNYNALLERLKRWPSSRDKQSALPDEPFNNAGEALLAKYRSFKTPWGSGMRLLTYYQQGKTGYGATNVELLYNFQGMTTDQRYYVSARLSVRHPLLPDSIDDPRARSEGTVEEDEAERKKIDGWSEISFFPPLKALDAMLASLRVKN